MNRPERIQIMPVGRDSNIITKTSTKLFGAFNGAARLSKILLSERRIPGAAYAKVFRTLDRLGIEKVTIRSDGMRVSGYTYIFWEYFIIRDKKPYDIDGEEFAPGMTVIDIGANQGWFTLRAASKGVKVVSFEPSKVNFGILLENVEQNQFSHLVKCFNCAVSGNSGTTTFSQGIDSLGRLLSTTGTITETDTNRGGVDKRSVIVSTTTLDEIFETNKIEVCDLLKLDCEGSEYDIISATSLATLRKIRNIALEYHCGRLDELKAWLARGGFDNFSVIETNADVGHLKAHNKSFAPGAMVQVAN
jgi:FkbM family methyltransferase